MKKIPFFCIILLAILFVCVLPARYGACSTHGGLKYIYLTFDDGPLAGSENIDRVVLAEKIKINVFIVGTVMESNKQLHEYFLLYTKNPYIDVYNHSFSHAGNQYAQYYKNPKGVLADIVRNETEFHLPYKIVRLPGGNVWRIGARKGDVGKRYRASADLLAAKGYTLFGWDLEWQHDSKTGEPVQSVDAMVTQINTLFETEKMFTPGHLVLLLHDEMFRKSWEESELKQLIIELNLRGYMLESLRRYPNVAA